jgi:iron-sulfur cluster assembly protein
MFGRILSSRSTLLRHSRLANYRLLNTVSITNAQIIASNSASTTASSYSSLSNNQDLSSTSTSTQTSTQTQTPKKWSRHIIGSTKDIEQNKEQQQEQQEKPQEEIKKLAIDEKIQLENQPQLKRRKRRTLKPLKAPITLTEQAKSHLKALSSGPNPKLIRISVRNRGCSGLTYHLEYVDKPEKFDEIVIQDDIKIIIDSKALFSIIGSEMDWVDNKLSSKFVFKNPNSKGTCGCGESFMV